MVGRLCPRKLLDSNLQVVALKASREEYDECAAATAKAWEVYADACAAREEDADAVLDGPGVPAERVGDAHDEGAVAQAPRRQRSRTLELTETGAGGHVVESPGAGSDGNSAPADLLLRG